MIIIMFITALALSGVAAFYAIAGLMAIFAAAPVSIAIMGSLLEAAKLVVASWTYRNWSNIPFLLKGYFCLALVILMFLTSMGIFGFLSKSHLDQTLPKGNVVAKIEAIDEKIFLEKEKVNEYRAILAQLDEQVSETMARTSSQQSDRGVRRSISIRKSQSQERAELRASIEASQKEILQLTEEKAPLTSELREVEAEVGPIKYIAALIYGDSTNEDILEKAVRAVIILLVIVFDPLAVLMLIAANWSLVHRKDNDNTSQNKDDKSTKTPGLEPTIKKSKKKINKKYKKPILKSNVETVETSNTWESNIEYDSHGRRITP